LKEGEYDKTNDLSNREQARMKTVFDELNIKFYKLPWWKRILFFFLKTHIGVDYGSKDESVITMWKIWRGKYYLVEERDNPSQIKEELGNR